MKKAIWIYELVKSNSPFVFLLSQLINQNNVFSIRLHQLHIECIFDVIYFQLYYLFVFDKK